MAIKGSRGDVAAEYTAREAWRLFGIMSEFVEATERLEALRPAVSIFGSARLADDDKYYLLTDEIARMPIILVGAQFWTGLVDSIRAQMVDRQLIAAEDVELMQVIDEPDAIVASIFRFYEARGFSPSSAEREGFQYL